MASKRTENIIIGVVAAWAAAVFISNAFEPEMPPAPVAVAGDAENIQMVADTQAGPSPPQATSEGRQITDADRA